jgi:hypothetical protein
VATYGFTEGQLPQLREIVDELNGRKVGL